MCTGLWYWPYGWKPLGQYHRPAHKCDNFYSFFCAKLPAKHFVFVLEINHDSSRVMPYFHTLPSKQRFWGRHQPHCAQPQLCTGPLQPTLTWGSLTYWDGIGGKLNCRHVQAIRATVTKTHVQCSNKTKERTILKGNKDKTVYEYLLWSIYAMLSLFLILRGCR